MLRSLVSILLLVLSVSVSSQTVSYDYIQASFGRVDFDSNNFDADGLGFSASFSIDDDFHVFGQHQTADLSFGVDINILELGGGYHTEISRNLNLSANVGYLEINGSGIGSQMPMGYLWVWACVARLAKRSNCTVDWIT